MTIIIVDRREYPAISHHHFLITENHLAFTKRFEMNGGRLRARRKKLCAFPVILNRTQPKRTRGRI